MSVKGTGRPWRMALEDKVEVLKDKVEELEVNMEVLEDKGFNNNTSGVFLVGTAPALNFRATTDVLGTGGSPSLTANTNQGPLAFTGPAAPLNGRSFGKSTFAQGPSIISGAISQRGPCGPPSTSRHYSRKISSNFCCSRKGQFQLRIQTFF
ncbi:hypothetical protein TREES_T100020262 [Tupaia chinensis]|uniref:Uncharacterized protein n=1 Tax=Tupaia chinensis TaxID=246437 RepID=L9L745_TUPCH|nr:hypothetical protein TREES_T100020262 [Tupaia chinensis]